MPSVARITFLQELPRHGLLGQDISLFYHRPLETDSVEQLMEPSWLQCLCLYPVVVSVVIYLKPRRGRKLLQTVDKEGTCHDNLEELGRPGHLD